MPQTPQDTINKLRSGGRINETEAQRMRKGLTKEQIMRQRSGAQISAAEAKRFKAMAKGGRKLAGKAAGAAGRRKLPKSLTSEKRGKMTKRGGMSLGRCP